MTDETLTHRLRTMIPTGRSLTAGERFEAEQTGKEGADALDAKDQEIARLRKALRPFACLSQSTTQEAWETRRDDRFKDWIDFEYIEEARAVLGVEDKHEEEEEEGSTKVIVTFMTWETPGGQAMDEATSAPIKVSEQDLDALKILCCGAVDRVGGNYELTEPFLVQDAILSDESLKRVYMFDPDTDEPWDEETFKQEFDRELADRYIDRASTNLSKGLEDLYFAEVLHRIHGLENDDGYKDKEIVPYSFIAYEVVAWEA